jgi:hypothetical protein
MRWANGQAREKAGQFGQKRDGLKMKQMRAHFFPIDFGRCGTHGALLGRCC